jgi:uncharacterized protein
MTAKCPMCGKVEQWEGNAFRPFCSERCQLLDLEGWFSERYRIPDAEEEEEEEPEERARDEKPASFDNGKT